MFKKALYPLAMLAAVISMMFASCGDNVVEGPGSMITGARLNVVVRDAVTGEVLPDAAVSLLSVQGKAPATTLADGYATFRDVYVGDHSVLVELAGYAGMIVPAKISRDESVMQDPYYVAQDVTVEVRLYPLTASITGEVNYKNDGDSSVAAVGANVRITFYDTDLVEKYRDAVTVVGGRFAFTDLPAGVGYTLEALNYTPAGAAAGTVYPRFTLSTGQALVAGDASYVVAVQSYPAKISSFRYIGWTEPKTIAANAPVVLEFSADLDKVAIGLDPLTFTPAQAVDLVYTANTITLVPYGEWNSSFTIRVAPGAQIVSTTGEAVQSIGTLSVVLDHSDLSVRPAVAAWVDSTRYPDPVSPSNIPQWTSTQVSLRWNSVAGATGYEIYRKDHGKTSFVYLDATSSVVDTFKIVNLGSVLNDQRIEFVVRGVNNRSKTPLTGAVPVAVVSRPTVASSVALSHGSSTVTNTMSINSISTDLQGTAGTAANVYYDQFITFTEEMNTNPLPTTAWVNPTSDVTIASITNRITAEVGWYNSGGVSDNKTLRVRVRVVAGNEITASVLQMQNIKWTVTGLVSAGTPGNPFFIEYTNNDAAGKTRKEVVRSLDIAFNFTNIPFSVTYDGNGATSGTAPVDGNLYQNGTSVFVTGQGSLVRTGHMFVGWGTTPSATVPVTSPFTITTNTTLYAIWAPVMVGISFILNDNYLGYTVSNGGYPPSATSAQLGSTFVAFPTNEGYWVHPLGYSLMGWSTDPYSSTPITSYPINSESPIIFYAIWR